MPDHVTQNQLDDGYHAIIAALDVTDLRRDLERALAILGYTINVLLVVIKPEYRFAEALKIASLMLDTTHAGLLAECDDPDA